MPSSVSIKREHRKLNNFLKLLSGDRGFEQFENDVYYIKYYWNHIVINCVNILFFLLFILSTIAFFWIAGHGLLFDIIKNYDFTSKIIKGIEIIFISPIPLLITTAFHNYYKNIIIPIIYYKMYGVADNDKTLNNEYYELNKISSLVDMGIIKYLFTSIFISTIFVFMLGRMIKISGEENEHGTKTVLNLSESTNKNESVVNINFKNDSSNHTHTISEAELTKINNLHKDDMNTSIKYDLFSLCIGVVSIILLIIYLRIIGINLNEDIQNSIKYKIEPFKEGEVELAKALLKEGKGKTT